MALQEPYPASPSRLPKFGFTFFRDGEFHSYLNFHARYAAARFVKSVIQQAGFSDKGYKWVNDATITFGNISIKADSFTQMEEVIEHRDTKEEAEWEQQSPYPAYVQAIIGRQYTPPSREVEKPIPTRAKSEQKAPPARKASPEGMITAAILADALQTDPRHLRAALRKSGLEKPASGWAWPNNELEAIKEKLKPFLK